MNILSKNKLSFGLTFSESAKKYFFNQEKKMLSCNEFKNTDLFIKQINKLKNLKTLSDKDKIYMYEYDNKIQLVFQENNEFSNHAHILLTKEIDSEMSIKDINKILAVMQFFKVKR